MNHASEHDIDRVLTALRDTEPGEGMESRILRALENRTPARTAWFRWTSPMRWSLGALATAAVIFAVVLTAHNTRRSTPGTAQSPVLTSSQSPVISTEGSRLHATRSGEIAAFTEASAIHAPAHLKSAPAYTPHELLCDCDPLAIAEMQAPSLPAPEMPLTAQERLLQRVVRRGDPIEVAELDLPRDNALRAAVKAKEKEDDAVKNVVQSFLKQVAVSEALNPTSPVADTNDSEAPVESSSSPN